MDIIDNLMYANYASALQESRNVAVAGVPGPLPNPLADPTPVDRIISNYIPSFPGPAVPLSAFGLPLDPVFRYDITDKIKFCSYADPAVVEECTLRHWYDINARVNYDSTGVMAFGTPAPALPVTPTQNARYASFEKSSTYHLMFAYLVENTRMLQIFERVLDKYFSDEELGIADNNIAFNWLMNSERLFFKSDTMRSSNIRSLIRPSADASRRNAYWRMFGMDLAFGDINSQGGAPSAYHKAKTSNQQFIPLFEKYLSEVWQAFTNAKNSSGVNTSDIDSIISLTTDLQELLRARRGDTINNSYGNLNLSREEFASVLMTSWFTIAISDNTPIVQFLKCESSTIGERLIKIGNKVGIQAHNKSQDLFELASPAANILRKIEDGGILDNQTTMTAIIKSLDATTSPTDPNINLITDLLSIINYWEKATGHKIKNPEANIRGTVNFRSNGVKTPTHAN